MALHKRTFDSNIYIIKHMTTTYQQEGFIQQQQKKGLIYDIIKTKWLGVR